MANEKTTPVDDDVDVAEPVAGTAPEDEPQAPPRMNLSVSIEASGPCRRHVRVTVPRADIDNVASASVDELMSSANVPGFRIGHVPEQLIRKRFRKELANQVKQKVLVQSLEQISEEQELDPINVPNLDPEDFEIPEEGDFEYEFDVEVRPEFELPQYKGLRIERPVREITEEDVDEYIEELREQYGHVEPVDEPVSPGDFVTVNVTFSAPGQPPRRLEEQLIRVRPTLRFQDGELRDFDRLMAGASAGDVREADVTVSLEAETVAMRGETVHATFEILDVKRLRLPELSDEFLGRLSMNSVDELRQRVREMLERQVTYQQRQATRRQVLAQITESADWDLPEDLVRKQVENALRREILEMKQAGFSPRDILARENELRQRSISMTRKNLKEHFVLDRIAEEEQIEVTPEDIETEINIMALQSGENPRRVRARLQKSGMIDNLEAQIRERKAVDIILQHATFTDRPMPRESHAEVEAIDRSICNPIADTTLEPETETDAD